MKRENMMQARQVSPRVLLHWRTRLLDGVVCIAELVCARVESLGNGNHRQYCVTVEFDRDGVFREKRSATRVAKLANRE
jgi:hypothetical protein